MLLMGEIERNEVIYKILLDNIIKPIYNNDECYIISYRNSTIEVNKNTSLIGRYNNKLKKRK